MRDAHVADLLELALGSVGAGLRVQGEGAVAAEVLEFGEAMTVDAVEGFLLRGEFLSGSHGDEGVMMCLSKMVGLYRMVSVIVSSIRL